MQLDLVYGDLFPLLFFFECTEPYGPPLQVALLAEIEAYNLFVEHLSVQWSRWTAEAPGTSRALAWRRHG